MRSSSALALGAVVAFATPASAFDDAIRGATASASFGAGSAGDTLMAQVGAAWAALRVYDGAWLVQWDLLVALRAGYLGNEHPYAFLVGPHASSWIEGGYRFKSARRFSPYVGARLSGDASYLGATSGPPLADTNIGTDVAGPVARGAVRIGAGSAYLDEGRAFVATLFVQEAIDGAQLHADARAFTEGGVSLRFDVAGSLMTSLDGFCGATFARDDALRGTTTTTTRCGLAALARKVFRNGMWLGASLSLEHDTDRVSYTGGMTYDTGEPPAFGVALSYGVRPWRSR